MVNLHPLQIEDMTQHGPAVNTNNVPNPEPAPHSEGQEKMLETQQTEEAINIWNMAKQLVLQEEMHST